MEKVLGIVVEYNPFHYGHHYHLRQANKLSQSDAVIAVMSGHFVQRGEPAVMDWDARVRVALNAGVNLVIMLPGIYSNQDAGGFALGSIGLLHHTGLVTDLVFGSESADLETMRLISEVLVDPPEAFRSRLSARLKEGLSFPNARKHALYDFFSDRTEIPQAQLQLVEGSNDILGLEYLNALKVLKSSIEPHVISRVGADDNDTSFQGRFSSATAIRQLFTLYRSSGDTALLKSIQDTMPPYAWETFRKEVIERSRTVGMEDLCQFILLFLRGRNRDHLKAYQGVEEGLDIRLAHSAKKARSIRDLLQTVKAKRFTHSRLRRMMINLLFEIHGEMIHEANHAGPQYIRVLGFDTKGQALLAQMREAASLPVITTPSLYLKTMDRFFSKARKKAIRQRCTVESQVSIRSFRLQFELDMRMGDLYRSLSDPEDQYLEIQRRPVIIRS